MSTCMRSPTNWGPNPQMQPTKKLKKILRFRHRYSTLVFLFLIISILYTFIYFSTSTSNTSYDPFPISQSISGPPHLTFLFLIRTEINHPNLWQKFFENSKYPYSIYIHTDKHKYDDDFPLISPFFQPFIIPKEYMAQNNK